MKKTTVTGIGYSGISVEHIDHDLEYTNYVREVPTYSNPPSDVPRSKRKEALIDEFEEPIIQATKDQNVRLKKERDKDLKKRNINPINPNQ